MKTKLIVKDIFDKFFKIILVASISSILKIEEIEVVLSLFEGSLFQADLLFYK
jgi:hypothetical protein